MRWLAAKIAARRCAFQITPCPRRGLFGQPRFAKALNQHLRVCLTAPSDPRRYCKGGIGLEQMRRRLTRLSVTSEMSESGRKAAVSCRPGRVLTFRFLACDDGLVKPTKLDKGKPHPTKTPV